MSNKGKQIALVFGVVALLAYLVFASPESSDNLLSVNDRAVWGIGEDGTRIVPQPQTILIELK
jgi:hypothetical protein